MATAKPVLIDPTEPRVLPPDGQAWFTINWLSSTGKLSRQEAFQLDEMETVLGLTAGQSNIYMSQCFFDRPVRRHPFVQHITHTWVDLDSYNVPHFAKLSRDGMIREIRLRCEGEGIPQPSAVIGSGRGYYPKWYFSEPVGREGVGRIVGVNRGLVRALAPLGADPKATDCTRILRVTGSKHTNAGRMVELLHLEHLDGHTITYDADDFAQHIVPQISEAPSERPSSRVGITEREAQRSHSLVSGFTREGWHWAIVEDCYTLVQLRWNGTVPEGFRDIFGHVIACQLARIFPPSILFHEIIAAVSKILPPEYVGHDLRHHSSTLIRLARRTADLRNRRIYGYSKSRLMELLKIEPGEERWMRALISDAESYRRKLAAQVIARRAAGMVERAEFEAAAAARRERAKELRMNGRSWAEVAVIMGLSGANAARMLTRPRGKSGQV